jgi:hypothetical protein
MKKSIIIFILILVIIISMSTASGTEQGTQNNVKGTLTINEDTFQLKHIYVFEQEDEVAVFMTDNPVSQDNVPYDLGDMAYEDKLYGLSIGISKSDKSTEYSANNAIYHKLMMGRGALADVGKLTIKKFDSKVLEASLALENPGVFPCMSCPEDIKYQYNVTFKVNLAADGSDASNQAVITVTGDDTPAGKAYATYYKAKLSGNIEEVKKWVIKEHVKDLDGEMGKMMINMAMAMDPKIIKIVKTEVSGNSADLTIEGVTGDQSKATGHVKMLNENGQWKVATDKWKMSQ